MHISLFRKTIIADCGAKINTRNWLRGNYDSNSGYQLKYFEVVAASAEIGVAKPDPLIFEKALELAGCQPCDSVMVGDRLDNDIRPAKALGMQTVWIRKGLSEYQPVALGKNVEDWIIENLSDLKAIFE